MKRNVEDDNEPIDRDFMGAEGWYYLDCGVWGYKVEQGFRPDADGGTHWYVGLQLNTAGQTLQIVTEDGDRDSMEMAVPCQTRGDIRRIHAVFGRRAIGGRL